jgi:hypothetical protein
MKDSVKTFLIIALIIFWTMLVATLLKYENNIEHLEEVIENKASSVDSLGLKLDSLVKELEYYDIQHHVENYKNEFINLLDAIIHVESSNDDSAYHKGENAVGCLQIRKTMVDDVNRILRKQGATDDELYSYEDRWERILSIQMFKIYCEYYTLETAEEIARCWNGGPRGMDKDATSYYWNKVKSELEEINS